MASNSQVKMAASTEASSSSTTTTTSTATTSSNLTVVTNNVLERTVNIKEPSIRTVKPMTADKPVTTTQANGNNDLEPPASKKPALEQRYDEFLKLVNEIGRDVKPAYTNSKSHGDRLKRNITTARGILRECLGELDRLSRQETVNKSNSPSIKPN